MLSPHSVVRRALQPHSRISLINFTHYDRSAPLPHTPAEVCHSFVALQDEVCAHALRVKVCVAHSSVVRGALRSAQRTIAKCVAH